MLFTKDKNEAKLLDLLNPNDSLAKFKKQNWHGVYLGRGQIFNVSYFKTDCRMIQCHEDKFFTFKDVSPRTNELQWTALCGLKDR